MLQFLLQLFHNWIKMMLFDDSYHYIINIRIEKYLFSKISQNLEYFFKYKICKFVTWRICKPEEILL